MKKINDSMRPRLGAGPLLAGLTALVSAFLLLAVLPAAALAAELPERGLSAAFLYPGLTVGQDEESLNLPIIIRNQGRQDDSFLVEVTEKPENWRAEVRGFVSVISGQFVSGQGEASLNLAVFPPEGSGPPEGQHKFVIRIFSLDGRLSRESACILTVRPAAEKSAPLKISVSHPQIKGPSDSRFSFNLDLANQGPEDMLVGLSAEAPEDWEAYFKPGYEDKRISSIQLPKGQKRGLNLELKPAYRAEAGLYPVKVRAEGKNGSALIDLSVELSGTYGLKLFPANELLSASSQPGQPVSMGFFVMNEGTALQKEVRLTALAPDNWQVEIEPKVLTDVAAGRVPTPVKMTVTPPPGALIGDYGLGLIAEGEKSRSALDLRVSLKAKAAWAWLGVGIIVLTVSAMAFVFRRLGRR